MTLNKIGSALAAASLASAPVAAENPANIPMPNTQNGCLEAYQANDKFDVVTCINHVTELAKVELETAKAKNLALREANANVETANENNHAANQDLNKRIAEVERKIEERVFEPER